MCRAKDQGETKEEPRNDQRTPKLKKSTFIKIAVSFTSLIPCPIPPRELRETTDSTPHYPKVLFIKIAFLKMLTPFLKKLTKVLK